MNNDRVLDISWGAIFKVAILIIAFYILFQVKDILILFIFAIIISMLFSPGIDFFMRFKLPRVVAASLIYLLSFGLFAIIAYFIVSILVTEIEQFSRVMPAYFRELSSILMGFGIHAFEDVEIFIESIKGSLKELTTALFSVSSALFGGLFTTLFVMTMAFFISLEGKLIERAMVLISPKKYENQVSLIWKNSQKQVSGWFFTRILSCIFVGVAVYLSTLIIGIEYPLFMGLIAGTLNFIPYIGPLISAIFIFLITLMDSPSKAVFILTTFAIIQFFEERVLGPVFLKKFVGMSPVLMILALAIGGTLWGFLGALLAVPLTGIIFEFLKEFFEKRKRIAV